jgi:hypothetical protein
MAVKFFVTLAPGGNVIFFSPLSLTVSKNKLDSFLSKNFFLASVKFKGKAN